VEVLHRLEDPSGGLAAGARRVSSLNLCCGMVRLSMREVLLRAGKGDWIGSNNLGGLASATARE